MRIQLLQSQTVQADTGHQDFFEAGLVRGQWLDVVIGDGPNDIPIHHYRRMRLVGDPMQKPLDDTAKWSFTAAGIAF